MSNNNTLFTALSQYPNIVNSVSSLPNSLTREDTAHYIVWQLNDSIGTSDATERFAM